MTKKNGFTLIELVVVIVILGILAAVAAPKFIDLSTEAKISTLEAMQGTLKSGTHMVYAKAIVENKTDGNRSIFTGGTTIQLNSGYPKAIWNNSIRHVANLSNLAFTPEGDICQLEWCGTGNALTLPSGKSTVDPGRLAKFYLKGYSWLDECGVYYINHADGSEPEIGLETADC